MVIKRIWKKGMMKDDDILPIDWLIDGILNCVCPDSGENQLCDMVPGSS